MSACPQTKKQAVFGFIKLGFIITPAVIGTLGERNLAAAQPLASPLALWSANGRLMDAARLVVEIAGE